VLTAASISTVRRTGNTGDYPSEEVAQMAHSLAVKAITTP